MAGDFFLWALAGATVAAAIALLVLLFRRTRPGPFASERRLDAGPRGRSSGPDRAWEAADPDDEPDADWGDPRGDGDPDLAKICPACGQRYGLECRTCDRDNSELAAIN